MSAPKDDYEVGYKRPPKHTRWKPGQSGNPKRKRKNVLAGVVSMIDRKFRERIDIIENGVPRQATTLEAILLRLLAKEMSGSKRASAVRLKFQEFIPKPEEPRKIIIRDFDEHGREII
jgi:hypothetical protein